MNGYKILAQNYKKLADEGKLDREVAEKEIRNLEFLATCDKDDICILFDSGAFNDILKGYLAAAVDEAELDPDAKARVKDSLLWVLDTKSASDILR